MLSAHPGDAPVELCFRSGSNGLGDPILRFKSLTVDPAAETLSELREVLGKGRVGLTRA